MTVKQLIEHLKLYDKGRTIRIASNPFDVWDILSIYDCNREKVVWIDIEEVSKKRRKK